MLSHQVCVRMKQYKDELLASCLTFVLSLHHNIVAVDIRVYCPALEVLVHTCVHTWMLFVWTFRGLFVFIRKHWSTKPFK